MLILMLAMGGTSAAAWLKVEGQRKHRETEVGVKACVVFWVCRLHCRSRDLPRSFQKQLPLECSQRVHLSSQKYSKDIKR